VAGAGVWGVSADKLTFFRMYTNRSIAFFTHTYLPTYTTTHIHTYVHKIQPPPTKSILGILTHRYIHIYPSIYPPIHPPIHPSTQPTTHPSIHPPTLYQHTRTSFHTLRFSMLRGKPSTKNLREGDRAMAALFCVCVCVCVCVCFGGYGVGIDMCSVCA
jgi:hypothetical protein